MIYLAYILAYLAIGTLLVVIGEMIYPTTPTRRGGPPYTLLVVIWPILLLIFIWLCIEEGLPMFAHFLRKKLLDK